MRSRAEFSTWKSAKAPKNSLQTEPLKTGADKAVKAVHKLCYASGQMKYGQKIGEKSVHVTLRKEMPECIRRTEPSP